MTGGPTPLLSNASWSRRPKLFRSSHYPPLSSKIPVAAIDTGLTVRLLNRALFLDASAAGLPSFPPLPLAPPSELFPPPQRTHRARPLPQSAPRCQSAQ